MAGQISESDQTKQFKEILRIHNKFAENCFLACLKDFTIREVKAEEEYHIQQNKALAAKAGLLEQPL
ncbi:mitochondrial import inner membrane translocase subunit Tim9 [Antrostomus carolinensis]|uniref:mitochondrial import inner membrane translocase subunit Tim9 n=1 Tax=Antrostomus carolinensis TaxID=279965 RepID=UPI0010A987CA|nr:mitochondrial import inner membrane translocase subunit Tim9 [Antrostomus carolinensis]